jgi:glycosyltransferase involved in cell wall biosynthesis
MGDRSKADAGDLSRCIQIAAQGKMLGNIQKIFGQNMHRHRILYINEEAGSVGGGGTSLLHLFKGLDKRRFEPIILCPATWGLRAEAEKLGVRVVPTWLPSWTKGKSIPFIIPAILKLARFLYREKICLIIYCGIRQIPYGFFATKFVSTPSICRIGRGSVVKRWHLKAYLVNSPNCYIVPAENSRSILESAGIDGQRLTVIHHGLDLDEIHVSISKDEARKKLGVNPNFPMIVSLGRFVTAKGFEHLIQAVAIIKKTIPKIKCIIIAEKPKSTTDESSRKYYESLQALVDNLNLKENVDFVGFKYGAEKYLYLSAMDVFVLPSIEEEFGIVLLEAMAMRRPMVASNVGGVPEIVVDGKTGLLVPSTNPYAISQAVIDLLLHLEKAKIMGEEGQKRVETYFTCEHEAREHEKLYETLLKCCKYNHDGN